LKLSSGNLRVAEFSYKQSWKIVSVFTFATKAPSLLSDEAKKASDDDLAKGITEKAKHPAPIKSLAPDQVKTVVQYIRSLQK
jgi:hypothetical protein